MSSSSGASPETSLLRIPAFRNLLITRLTATGASRMLSVVVGWQIYDLTDSALALGMIGLVQFLPSLLLALVSGEVADRFDRRTIIRVCYCLEAVLMACLMVLSMMDHPAVWAFYVILGLNAVVGTFEGPAQQSLLPSIVPRDILRRGVAAYTSSSRIASLTGPVIGGFIYALGPATAYFVCMALTIIAAIAAFRLPRPPVAPAAKQKASWETITAGMRFIWSNKILLGVLSLDLVATFFGGLNALMPIFARDILEIGPVGLGVLRSSPAVGSLLTSFIMTRYPINRAAGHAIFYGVALYGVMTIIFALSESVYISIPALFLLGAGDTISQVNRKTLIQAMTPDHVLGRVNAVGSLSVTVGGQLGQFESGVAAALLGTVGSALFGGIAVLVVVALWAYIFPALRRVERADDVEAVLQPAKPEIGRA